MIKSSGNEADSPRAVVLVHGLSNTTLSLRRIGSALSATGRVPRYFSYSAAQPGGLRGHADALLEFLSCVSSSSSSVDIVTHSYGALMLREVLDRGGDGLPLGKVVMITPIFNGCQLAGRAWELSRRYPVLRPLLYLGLGTAAADLHPDRVATRPLTIENPPETGVIRGRFRNLFLRGLPNDGTVTAADAAVPYARESVELPYEHNIIIFMRRTIQLTRRFLEEGSFGL